MFILGRLGGGPLIHRTVFRCWVRPGGTNAASDEMRVASHPAAERTDKHNALRLRDMRSLQRPQGSQSANGTELPGRRPPEGQCPSGAHGEQKDVEGFRVGLGPALNASTPSEVIMMSIVHLTTSVDKGTGWPFVYNRKDIQLREK